MKKIKKLVAILLCLLLAFGLLTACAKEAGEVTNAPLELTLGIWPADKNTDEITLHQGYATKFAAAHPDIAIVPAHYSYAVDTFLPTAKAGKLPVVFQAYDTVVQKVMDSGYAADITDILAERGWLDAVNPGIRSLLSQNGRIYGIPGDGYALGLMVNGALFREAGVVDAEGIPLYPKTWTELAETGKKIKDTTGAAGFCLLAMDNAAGWQFANIAWSFGAVLVKENAEGSFTSELDTKEAIAAMEYVKDLKWKYDILTADPASENYGTSFTQLGTGKAAMCIAASDMVEQPTAVIGLGAEDLGLAPMPAGPSGEQYSLYGGNAYMFSKDATEEQVNAALDYIAIMGKGPVLDSESYESDCKHKAEKGIPVLYPFPSWVGQARNQQELAVIEKYSNADLRLYQDYFDTIKKSGNLRLEKAGDSLYLELTPVIQAVLKDKNADVAALMKAADENYQKVLDMK